MIANIREPGFILRSHALDLEEGEQQPRRPGRLVVRDQSRVAAAGETAVEEGWSEGSLIEPGADLPASLRVVEFSLDSLEHEQERFLDRLREEFHLLEVLDYGEVQVGVEPEDRHRLRNLARESPLNLRITMAPIGWLARVLNQRPVQSRFQFVSPEQANAVLESIKRSEFWGLGSSLMEQFREMDVQQFGEVCYLSDQDRRRYFGKDARVIERLVELRDPRPLNSFSRPTSLTQPIDWPLSGNRAEKLQNHAGMLEEQLTNSSSLAHRIELNIRENNGTVHKSSRETGTPFRGTNLMVQKLLSLADEFPENLDTEEARIRLSGIVADLDQYHAKPQEDEADLEVL